jgi:hypothetical protein
LLHVNKVWLQAKVSSPGSQESIVQMFPSSQFTGVTTQDPFAQADGLQESAWTQTTGENKHLAARSTISQESVVHGFPSLQTTATAVQLPALQVTGLQRSEVEHKAE